MDTFNPVQAAAPPVAAEPVVSPQGTGPVGGVPEVNPALLGQGAPNAAAMPTVPGATTAPVSPAAPGTTAPDPAMQAIIQKAQAHDRLVEELRQLDEHQKQQRQQQQLVEQRNTRLQQAQTYAQNLTPEEGIAHMARVAQELVNQENAVLMQQAQQREAQMSQSFAQLAVPLYVAEIGAKLGLRAEYQERLKQLPPNLVDQYLPMVLQEQRAADEMNAKFLQMQNQLAQLGLSQQAGQLAATGVHQPSAPGGSPVPANPGTVVAGTRDHLLQQPGFARLMGYSQ